MNGAGERENEVRGHHLNLIEALDFLVQSANRENRSIGWVAGNGWFLEFEILRLGSFAIS